LEREEGFLEREEEEEGSIVRGSTDKESTGEESEEDSTEGDSKEEIEIRRQNGERDAVSRRLV